ncbi:unnamed protein product [Lactuca saligna]|uniref:Uncharacterized protein n=1 Tax=Lactuca saligna TaxID=75948 RepID=A0AA36ER50_LACSI|nr:unnamed protein product [Lactuca saligna]
MVQHMLDYVLEKSSPLTGTPQGKKKKKVWGCYRKIRFRGTEATFSWDIKPDNFLMSLGRRANQEVGKLRKRECIICTLSFITSRATPYLLVRVKDTPDEAPFMELGHVMPHLIPRHDYTTNNDLSPNLDKSSDGFLGNLDASVSVPAPVSEMGFLSTSDNPHWQLPEFNGLSGKHAQVRICEHEGSLKHLYYEGQSFHDESHILFPSAYSI